MLRNMGKNIKKACYSLYHCNLPQGSVPIAAQVSNPQVIDHHQDKIWPFVTIQGIAHVKQQQ